MAPPLAIPAFCPIPSLSGAVLENVKHECVDRGRGLGTSVDPRVCRFGESGLAMRGFLLGIAGGTDPSRDFSSSSGGGLTRL